MAGWDEILHEIQTTTPTELNPSPIDTVRKKYLRKLSEVTDRNVITYYSGFLSKNSVPNLEICDADMTGFMNAVRSLDCSKGLDLILHTPGGDPTATESIVNYLKSKFGNDIRVIVPHLAMSAGTMMAMSAKEIIMGNHSSLGPIDPQYKGIPAFSILQEFNRAKTEIGNDPNSFPFWKILLDKYSPAMIMITQDSIDLSKELATQWLGSNMLKDNNSKVDSVVDLFNQHDASKTHARHFDIKYCQESGLKIRKLEDDPDLQDAVLSLHHCYDLTFSITLSLKIIENQLGISFIGQIPQPAQQ